MCANVCILLIWYYANLEKSMYLFYGVHVKPVLAIKISGHFLKVYTAWWDAITTS